MTIYFSPSTGGFVHDEVNTIPQDAVPLSDLEYSTLLDECSKGKTLTLKNGVVEAVDPIYTETWTSIRITRNSRLSRSDWTQLPDANLDAEQKAKWQDYRQALRDLTESTTDPEQVVWPTPPTA